LAGDRLVFQPTHASKERGYVYLWVELSGDSFDVVYVGKTENTLKERFKQHRGGFTTSTPGRAHAARLRTGIQQNKRYVVYARKSETMEICGEASISMACVEELAFIQKFGAPWNARSGRRSRGIA
jgi:hypothetical protein